MIDFFLNSLFPNDNYLFEANLNYFSVLSEKVTVPGTPLEALMWGFIAFFIQPISAIFGAKFKISKKLISITLAFTSGVLIALLTYDLLDVSFELGGLFPTIIGLLI